MRVQLFKTIARARRPQPAVVDTSTHTVLKAVSRDVCEETGSYLEPQQRSSRLVDDLQQRTGVRAVHWLVSAVPRRCDSMDTWR